jgi:hypothetical protein
MAVLHSYQHPVQLGIIDLSIPDGSVCPIVDKRGNESPRTPEIWDVKLTLLELTIPTNCVGEVTFDKATSSIATKPSAPILFSVTHAPSNKIERGTYE